jgi:hypothetical protein
MPYDLFTHRHNFAVWAAARAAQRGFTSVQNLKEALEASGVQRFLPDPEFLNTTCNRFEELHKSWCAAIVASLNARAIQNVTYGRAAKLLAIYLKSMVIVGGAAYSPIARCIHPPIDRRLLQALADDSRHEEQNRTVWRKTNWTRLNEEEYYKLIRQLRASLPPEIPFWMLEEYWTASDEEE